MAGKKGRSGRKRAEPRAAFNAFAEGYEPDGRASRYEQWFEAEHAAAMGGDGQARRFLIEQVLGRAKQAVDLTRSENDPGVLAMKALADRLEKASGSS